MMNELELKNLMCDIGKRIYSNGFVAANDGNITARLDADTFLTTPTGVSKGDLTPDMIVKIDKEGNKIEGDWKPSSEVKVHLRIYAERPDVGAVVHAHPPYATSLSVAHISMDKYILPEAICALGAVPVVPYAQPSTQALANGLVPYIQDYDALLLENHGTVTVGGDLMAAYFKTETVEYYAKILYLTESIGKQYELPRPEIEKLIQMYRSMNPSARHPGYVKF